MKTFKRTKVYAATVAAVAVLGATVGVAAPAHAGLQNCPKGYLCVWKDSAYITDGKEAALVKFQYYISNYADFNYEGTSIGSANSATSIYNNGRYDTAVMYANSFKRTQLFTIPAGNNNWSLYGPQGDNIESGYYSTYN